MDVGGWQRWTLGLAVAAVIPIALGGGACGGKDVSPEPSPGAAGMSAVSGSSPGGSAAAGASGSSTGGSASGSSTGGGSAGYAGSGGNSSGGAGAECCTAYGASACTDDGQRLKSCVAAFMGKPCGSSSPGIYGYVWEAQACPSGCVDGGNGPHCR